jgi:hypothetical protein
MNRDQIDASHVDLVVRRCMDSEEFIGLGVLLVLVSTALVVAIILINYFAT